MSSVSWRRSLLVEHCSSAASALGDKSVFLRVGIQRWTGILLGPGPQRGGQRRLPPNRGAHPLREVRSGRRGGGPDILGKRVIEPNSDLH
jgi:hypothetical protein